MFYNIFLQHQPTFMIFSMIGGDQRLVNRIWRFCGAATRLGGGCGGRQRGEGALSQSR